MSVGTMLSNLIIGPLKLLFEVVFAFSNRVLSVGMSIAALSLIINMLVLPLYRRADAIQEEERETEARLNPGVRHIRKVFSGDERFMILQTYYRQNGYSPAHALKGAIPLLLEIPFFIAAYQFLSRLGSLQGASFGPISDLSVPDGLLKAGSVTVNLLPVLMTAINFLSATLYTRGAPLKTKVQLLGMSLVFLVLLYDSPAGLTFYWTLNNLFSLIKNILQKVLPKREGALLQAPKPLRGEARPGLFFLCALLMTVLLGMLIPSAVIAASPQDFLSYLSDPDPVWYVVQALLLAAGTFLLWGGVYYALGRGPVRRGMETGFWILFGTALVNYLFFRNNLGTISSTLVYNHVPEFTGIEKLINLGVLLAAGVVLYLLLTRKEKLVRGIAWTVALAMFGMTVSNLWTIRAESDQAYQAQARNYQGEAAIPLSREGKNVVILMMDRAINSYLPVMLHEKPELKEAFTGFTYYPNTLSFGSHTNFGAPALFGGYEYTPRAMNARKTEPLRKKHNESLLLLPTLFSREGYRITVFDAPYPGNYTEAGDYSIYDRLPKVNARRLAGSAEMTGQWDSLANIRLRNFFCYGISMTVPTALYGTVYNMGYYNRPTGSASLFSMDGQPSASVYSDLKPEKQANFIREYEVLCRMKEITVVREGAEGTLLLMDNCTTHEPIILPEPEYAPVRRAENEAYDETHADRFLAGPIPLRVNSDYQMSHYAANMAAFLRLGDWVQYLKQLGVYDNTRIIIVSDHGWMLGQIKHGIMKTGRTDMGYNPLEDAEDMMEYNPLLMVKDFGATGEIRTDTTFMTNADVPTIAMNGLIRDQVNPFTGNPVNTDKKKETQYVIVSHLADVGAEKGAQFDPAPWFAVAPGGETLFDPARWTFLPEKE